MHDVIEAMQEPDASSQNNAEIRSSSFLPNFCALNVLARAVGLGLALAAILVLFPLGQPGYSWEQWALAGWFVLGVIVCSLTLLCLLRRWLVRMRTAFAAGLSYVVVLAVTWSLSEATWYRVIVLTDWRQDALHHYLFIARNLGISGIVSAVGLHYLYVAHHQRIQAEAALSARLQALQSRIHPHFLFNSMNTIASLTRIDPACAEEAVEDLAELFRASLADARERISLGEELALCRRYLHIESLRLGERLRVEWDLNLLPDDALIPALTLQTLLENAVRHGIQLLAEGGTIHVNGLCDGRYLKFDLHNPIPEDPNQRGQRGHRIAHDNLRQRLEAYYGRRGRMETRVHAGEYQVTLRFPYERG